MQHWAELVMDVWGQFKRWINPYMKAGGKRPDPLPKLIAAHGEALHSIQQAHRGPIIFIGKSMGARVGCQVSLKEKVSAVVCFDIRFAAKEIPPGRGTRCSETSPH